MIGEGVGSVWIGCSTDGRYAGLTSVMLSSLDDNGAIPEATVIVGDFGLTQADRDMIRKAAGRLGTTMRFATVTRESPQVVALPSFPFPFPLFGRFVIPQLIAAPAARLVLLDSDMIVNRSLRPLFETHMRGHAIAAVHDSISWREHYGRPPKLHYFNAGMLMIDIDGYREQDIAARAMRRLAEYDIAPMWLEQDALNDIMGDDWLSLDRRWNFFHAADYRGFTTEDYAAADIIHFSGPKPWEMPHHPAAPIFRRHAALAEAKMLHRRDPIPGGTNRVFAAACYELLLGRQAESNAVLTSRKHFPPAAFIGDVLRSPEFATEVLEPMRTGAPFGRGRFSGAPTRTQRCWAVDRLPMLSPTAADVEEAESWRALLACLLRDRHLMGLGGLDPIEVEACGIANEREPPSV